MTELKTADDVIRGLNVIATIVDHEGLIVDVSEGWKAFAAANDLRLPGYGIGANYLDHSKELSGADSDDLLVGIRGVMTRKTSAFAALYRCDAPTQPRLFLLASFVASAQTAGTVILHLDVSHLLALDQIVGLTTPLSQGIRDTVAQAVQKALAPKFNELSQDSLPPPQKRVLARMNDRQLQIMRLLAEGASNQRIADETNLSLSAAKAQTASITKKLGFANRAQTAVLAAQLKGKI